MGWKANEEGWTLRKGCGGGERGGRGPGKVEREKEEGRRPHECSRFMQMQQTGGKGFRHCLHTLL